jgi:hypothetical protein
MVCKNGVTNWGLKRQAHRSCLRWICFALPNLRSLFVSIRVNSRFNLSVHSRFVGDEICYRANLVSRKASSKELANMDGRCLLKGFAAILLLNAANTIYAEEAPKYKVGIQQNGCSLR